MDEFALRHSLGIPDDAARVLVFPESSHWDPDWVLTSEEYYRRFVAQNLDAAIDALDAESRRVYSVECVFFLRMYWERNPERRDAIRRLVNERRLRMTSSGVTSADTLLPKTESILRDMLLGQEWLRANGMTQEPRLAYFTDSFGLNPALPSLLRAAGFDRTAFTRIDGMYFVGCEYEPARNYPRPGSSAERLLVREKTLDFTWRDVNGAEVLCHWNAFNYGQGDMITHRGIGRTYMFPLAFSDRSEGFVARRIASYAAQLGPVSRTPYMLCPIGFDFVGPIPGLVELLDRYNRTRYGQTGIWAVNAGLDDYLALVEAHRGALPVLALDPNPYWTGFYTARPALKRRCHLLVSNLVLAERVSLLPECREAAAGQDLAAELSRPWWHAATSNHHDFITGTSPDKVAEGEQWPWVEQSVEAVAGAIGRMRELLPRVPAGKAAAPTASHWTTGGGTVRVQTPFYLVEVSEQAGGCIVSAASPDGQTTWLTGPSNDLVSYRDSGGLWRMGHEYKGGYLAEDGRASDRPANLEIREVNGDLEVACDAIVDGELVRRCLRFRKGSPLIRGRILGRAAHRRTVGLAFETPFTCERIAMGQPGGVVTRPPRKTYDPTYWPAQAFVHFESAGGGPSVALCLAGPSAAACRERGRVEVVALRNATRERAYRVLPLLANPAKGYEDDACTFEYGILLLGGGDWRANRLPDAARNLGEACDGPVEGAAIRVRLAGQVVIEAGTEGDGAAPDLEAPDAGILAFKRASRGDGLILRLATASPPLSLAIRLRDWTVTEASLCDARERDIEPLAVRDGRVYVTMAGSIATLRLIVADRPG